jgi:hypothetical protein
VIRHEIDTTLEAQMPLGYLILSEWKDVADLPALHGVEMERTAKPLTQEFETYRFSGMTAAGGGAPSGPSFRRRSQCAASCGGISIPDGHRLIQRWKL